MTSWSGVDRVVDTNVIMYVFSDRAEDREVGDRYRRHLEGQSLAISFQTEAEISVHALAQRWQPVQVRSILSRFLVFPWSPELLAAYVQLRSESIRRSRPAGTRQRQMQVGPADGWIAATAVLLDCPLVTHDRHLAANRELIEVITELDLEPH